MELIKLMGDFYTKILRLLWMWKIDFFYQMTFFPPNETVIYNPSPHLTTPQKSGIIPENLK